MKTYRNKEETQSPPYIGAPGERQEGDRGKVREQTKGGVLKTG